MGLAVKKVSKQIQNAVNSILRPTGIEMVRRGATTPHVPGYLKARETINAAKSQGVSLCEYLESLWKEPGNTQAVIDSMAKHGVFDGNISSVCEIGAGSGRFAEKTLAQCRPTRYESYEPDPDWSGWLQASYGVISQPTDGHSLKYTSSASVELVHAHGVFVYLPFLTTYRYFREMARVVSEGGHIVFDILSEDCLDEEKVSQWLRSGQYYPCMLSRQYVLHLFESWGFALQGEFSGRLTPATSHYMVLGRCKNI